MPGRGRFETGHYERGDARCAEDRRVGDPPPFGKLRAGSTQEGRGVRGRRAGLRRRPYEEWGEDAGMTGVVSRLAEWLRGA